MVALSAYIIRVKSHFPDLMKASPWVLIQNAEKIITDKLPTLGPEYKIFNQVAIHQSVTIDSHAILKGPAIISAHCFVGAHTYIRGGVFLDEHVSLGPGCEVKTSFIFSHTALAHFNFIGDSVLGSQVNMEAGAVIANHFNERNEKQISVKVDGTSYATGMEKFGALAGDHCKIGANAVLSPGTVLKPGTVVERLSLVNQGG